MSITVRIIVIIMLMILIMGATNTGLRLLNSNSGGEVLTGLFIVLGVLAAVLGYLEYAFKKSRNERKRNEDLHKYITDKCGDGHDSPSCGC